ncbi:LemA family protein [bacterium]|nr:LemA family protein [bacterium]
MSYLLTAAIVVVIALVLLWLIVAYNRFIRGTNLVREAWSGIDVQLKRRHDLIPNIVEAVKGYSSHEREVFEEVAALRAVGSDSDDVHKRSEAENALTRSIKTLFAVALLAGLVACSSGPSPPRFGFYMSDNPWIEIVEAQEHTRGEIMWGMGFSIDRMKTTPVPKGRFSVWVYSDPPTPKLTLHLALYATEPFAEKRTKNVTYTTYCLEPYKSEYLRYTSGEGSAIVKRFDFDLNNPQLKEAIRQAKNAIPDTYALNSSVLGIAFVRATSEVRAHPQLDLPAPPETPKNTEMAFGFPVLPYEPGSYKNRGFGSPNPPGSARALHIGEDIALDPGTPIRAVADGTVVRSGKSEGYGAVIVVEHVLHDSTVVISIYGHVSLRKGYEPLALGKRVKRGQTIAYVGWDPNWPISSWQGVDSRTYRAGVADDMENGHGWPHLHMGLRIIGKRRNYKSGLWYRGYGDKSDIGHVTRDGEYVTASGSRSGSTYVAFSEFLANRFHGIGVVKN